MQHLGKAANTYYLARSANGDDRGVVEKVGLVFPNQASWRTHVNISGAGIAKGAPNRAAALQFLEYLASDPAQGYLPTGANEWPVVRSVKISNPALDAMGAADAGPRVGYKRRRALRPYPAVSGPRIDETGEYNAARQRYSPEEFTMAKLQDLLLQKEALEREIELTKKQERAEAIAKVRALMAEYGLTLSDLGTKAAAKAGSARGGKVPAKYRNKATGDSWSGRGLQPNWLKAALAEGRKIEDFAV